MAKQCNISACPFHRLFLAEEKLKMVRPDQYEELTRMRDYCETLRKHCREHISHEGPNGHGG